MELSKPKLLIKSFYDAIVEQSRTLALPAQLFLDLTALTKEVMVDRVINAIRGFGMNHGSAIQSSQGNFTSRQWRRLRGMIKQKYPQVVKHHFEAVKKIQNDKPFLLPSNFPERTHQHRVDLTKLPKEAVAILMNLVDTGQMSSSITNPVLDYFDFVKILTEERADLPVLLEPIRKVLESHGWTDGGFTAPPKQDLLFDDLQIVIGRSSFIDTKREKKVLKLARVSGEVTRLDAYSQLGARDRRRYNSTVP